MTEPGSVTSGPRCSVPGSLGGCSGDVDGRAIHDSGRGAGRRAHGQHLGLAHDGGNVRDVDRAGCRSRVQRDLGWSRRRLRQVSTSAASSSNPHGSSSGCESAKTIAPGGDSRVSGSAPTGVPANSSEMTSAPRTRNVVEAGISILPAGLGPLYTAEALSSSPCLPTPRRMKRGRV